MTFHTANAFDIIFRLDRDDTLDEVSQNNQQKVATGLLLDKLRTQDFVGPLSCRASRVCFFFNVLYFVADRSFTADGGLL